MTTTSMFAKQLRTILPHAPLRRLPLLHPAGQAGFRLSCLELVSRVFCRNRAYAGISIRPQEGCGWFRIWDLPGLATTARKRPLPRKLQTFRRPLPFLPPWSHERVNNSLVVLLELSFRRESPG